MTVQPSRASSKMSTCLSFAPSDSITRSTTEYMELPGGMVQAHLSDPRREACVNSLCDGASIVFSCSFSLAPLVKSAF